MHEQNKAWTRKQAYKCWNCKFDLDNLDRGKVLSPNTSYWYSKCLCQIIQISFHALENYRLDMNGCIINNQTKRVTLTFDIRGWYFHVTRHLDMLNIYTILFLKSFYTQENYSRTPKQAYKHWKCKCDLNFEIGAWFFSRDTSSWYRKHEWCIFTFKLPVWPWLLR